MHHPTNLSRLAMLSLLALSACALGKADDGSNDNSELKGDDTKDAATSVVLPPGPSSKDAGADSAIREAGPSVTNGTTPPRASDLVLWLDPEHVDVQSGSYTVVAWPDRTGKTAVATGGATLEPVGYSNFAARPGIAISDSAITATLTRALEQRPFSVFFVERNTNVMPVGWLFGTNDTATGGAKSNFGLQSLTVGEIHLAWSMTPFNGAFDVGVFNQGNAHVYSLRRKGTTVDVMVDAAHSTVPMQATYNANGVSGAPEQIFFGGVFGDVTLGDILVYDADLSDSDMFDVKAYLKARYSL